MVISFQVWRSIRDWDPQSRGMLSAYLNAAKAVIQEKQARRGVAVHVRLGGDTDVQGKEGSDGVSRNGVASSYAVWAVTGEVSTHPKPCRAAPALVAESDGSC